MKLSASDLFFVVLTALLLKFLIVGFSVGESIGALVLLSSLLAKPVLENLFPKRTDLFKEVSALRDQFQEVLKKTEGIESDVTALKFGAMRK